MADLVRMCARRRFKIAPQQRLLAGDVFHVSPALAERLIRRGDAVAQPEPAKPEPQKSRRGRKKAAA